VIYNPKGHVASFIKKFKRLLFQNIKYTLSIDLEDLNTRGTENLVQMENKMVLSKNQKTKSQNID